MLASDLSTFGAPYSDQEPVVDPTTQMAASLMNRALENVAQMTRTCPRIILSFPTTATPGSLNLSDLGVRTLWGSSDFYKPSTYVRNATAGEYVFAWPASFVDGLGETETLAFFGAHGSVNDPSTADTGFVKCVIIGTTLSVYIRSDANVATDLTVGTPIICWIY